jgi:hypothetical protein
VKIEQRLGLEKRTAHVLPDGVDVTFSGLFARERWKVRFEDLLREPVEFTQQPQKMPVSRAAILGLGLFFAFITFTKSDMDKLGGFIVTALCLGSVVLGSAFDRFPRRQLLQLSSTNPPLLLFANRPTADAVGEFRDCLYKAAAAYVQAHYPVDRSASNLVDQLERLQSLRTTNAITQEEYDQLKSRLIGSSQAGGSGQYL